MKQHGLATVAEESLDSNEGRQRIMASLTDSLSSLASQFERLLSGTTGQGGMADLLQGGLAPFRYDASSGALSTVISQFTGSALGGPLGVIANALTSLFRRDSTAPELQLLERPEALSLEFDVGRDTRARFPTQAREASGTDAERYASTRGSSTGETPVVIQVNTLDARSFADHRDDIASAVREALTRNHGLRDEIWEE